MCIHMGSAIFSLDPCSILIFSSTPKHQMPLRRDTGFNFPPELTQLIQQQNALMQLLVRNQGNNNNNNPPPVDNLARFLRLQPPVFSSSIEPIVADDWLHRIGRELTTAGCTDAEKVHFAAHQLDGPAATQGFILSPSYPLPLPSLLHWMTRCTTTYVI